MRTDLKTAQSQMLNAEVEAFLAKGGKIKVVSNTTFPAKKKIKLKAEPKQGAYYNSRFNKKIREYCKTGESLARLSHKAMCSISLLEKYINGEVELSEGMYNSDFSYILEELSFEKFARKDIREHIQSTV